MKTKLAEMRLIISTQKRASAFIASVFAEVDFISYSGRPAKLSLIKT